MAGGDGPGECSAQNNVRNLVVAARVRAFLAERASSAHLGREFDVLLETCGMVRPRLNPVCGHTLNHRAECTNRETPERSTDSTPSEDLPGDFATIWVQ